MRSEMKKTLQELSLESIVKNFEKLMSVFNSNSGSIPRKCFEFLQRIHSRDLLEKLSVSDCLKDQFLSFLINPHLKKLDLSSNSFINVDVIIERLKLVGSYITTLDIRDRYFVEDVILELITLVPNVESLYLSQTESTDHVLKCIGKHCPSLHTLDVCFCSISTEGLKGLCEKDERGEIKKNYKLKHLDISATSVGEDGVSFALSHFPSLEELNHDYVGGTIFKAYQSHFLEDSLDSQQKYNLKKLNIQTYYMSFQSGYGFVTEMHDRPLMKDVLKVCSVLCPQVSFLSVDSAITQGDLLTCADFPLLKEVKLSSSTSDLIDYSPFLQSSGHSLVSIDLEGGILSVELVSKCCPKLEKLMLQSMRFEKISETAPSSEILFPNLNFLYVEGMELLNDTAESLSFVINCSPELEILHVQNCRLTDGFVATILNSKCMANIRKLDFSFSRACFSAVTKMLPVTHFLEKLVIEDCDISDAEYQDILAILRSENRSVEVSWKNGSTDYESDYENDFDIFHHDPLLEYDIDYFNGYDDADLYLYDDDSDDIDYYDVEDDFM